MTSVGLHLGMATQMRRVCRNRLCILIAQIHGLREEIDHADDTSMPTNELRLQLELAIARFCLVWGKYRRAAMHAAFWAAKARNHAAYRDKTASGGRYE